MQGRHPELSITLGDEEIEHLKKILRSKKTEFRLVQRAKIILLASENKYNPLIPPLLALQKSRNIQGHGAVVCQS